MQEQDMRRLIEDVREGKLPRRTFINQMLTLGLTAPMVSTMLTHAGIAQAQTTPAYKPTKRGGGGALKTLFWQGATLLNPHFAVGIKDQEACRVFYEPLAAWDQDGNLVPVLAAEIPSRDNGGLPSDGKKGVTWHDGQPFTADDCVFNWEFARDPATAAVTTAYYNDVKLEKLDSHTVRVSFAKPTPFWATTFVGGTGMIIPRHVFAAYQGAKSREAPANIKPVGTGPYRFVEFKPGDMVRGELNPAYHLPNRPYFDTIEIKGGGDAASAARAVLQTGEYDYAWNVLVEDELLKRMEESGKGRLIVLEGGNVEVVVLNAADPATEVDGERASPKSRHPIFSDPEVRRAFSLLLDRKGFQDFIFGRIGLATGNIVINPPRYRSPNTKWEFNVDKANAILDAAGWQRGADGVREKAGRKMKLVFQTSTNGPRQKTQAIIKQACQRAGIEIEVKSVVASVYFSTDVGNPDTFGKFWADIEMLTFPVLQPDPERHMDQFTSWEISSKANKWQGRNFGRWSSEEYDKLFRAAEGELDPVKRAALFIRMNDLVCSERYAHPISVRGLPSGVSRKLNAPLAGWDNALAHLRDWYREA
jgi:peptide/nickel transport system substrate-binding protein